MNATRCRPGLLICQHCDAVYTRVPLTAGEHAECRVCGASLYRRSRLDINAMLALTVAALIVFVLANASPIVMMESGGVTTEGWLWTMVAASWDSGIGVVALIAAATVFLFPLAQLALYVYVLQARRRGHLPLRFAPAMRMLHWLRHWSMVEVFLVGILVSIVKMSGLATVLPQAGLWGFGVLTLLLTLLASFDLRDLWERPVPDLRAPQIKGSANGPIKKPGNASMSKPR